MDLLGLSFQEMLSCGGVYLFCVLHWWLIWQTNQIKSQETNPQGRVLIFFSLLWWTVFPISVSAPYENSVQTEMISWHITLSVPLLGSDISQNFLSQAKTFCRDDAHSETQIRELIQAMKPEGDDFTQSAELFSLLMIRFYPSFKFNSSTI